ncbi:hypothetical protein CYMTET_38844 [Cymbomonas tetramitiformis]|uniref:WAT1-related protein n=1 Tax=Cymbomonas tetramitiformis TaxID=36881 RepID=A0AAE0CDG0_9CHLO|nr:hypothetical protein CYMTET_38844 [Cymbomonas tetramitiformis]
MGIDKLDVQSSSFLGCTLLIVQVSSYAVYLLLLQRALQQHPHPVVYFGYANCVATVLICACALPEMLHADWGAIPLSAWTAALYAGIGVNVVAHMLNSWAVGYVDALLPALFSCIQPVAVILLSYMILDHPILPRTVCGAALIIGGLVAVTSAKAKEKCKQTHVPKSDLSFVDETDAWSANSTEDENSTHDVELEMLMPIQDGSSDLSLH